ncbi:MAG TPA: RluA family pseudouridine synthase [Pirellulales bacterium]|nr:RluA family pseudouridine synthase [Pirellulales bacterium]
MQPLEILYEDNHLLAVVKPVGLATMGVAEGTPSLLAVAKEYVKRRYHKPGNVYLGAMSRLDAPVSGVVLFARTSKAAARLTEQFRARTVEKIYWAVVTGEPPPAGRCVDWLAKDERHRRMRIAEAGEAGAQEARLGFRRLARLTHGWLLEVVLETGRKHQIRVQLSRRGWPVLGDRKYGSRGTFPVGWATTPTADAGPIPPANPTARKKTPQRANVNSGIGLHARQLTFSHPTRGQTICLVAPLPAAWTPLGIPE